MYYRKKIIKKLQQYYIHRNCLLCVSNVSLQVREDIQYMDTSVREDIRYVPGTCTHVPHTYACMHLI